MSERDYRISSRDWEPLTDERIEEILDDTGGGRPNAFHSDADIYALAREVRALRELKPKLEAMQATVVRIIRECGGDPISQPGG